MRVRMNRTTRGSPDGLRAFTYRQNEVYDATTDPPMTQALANVLVAGELAVEVATVDPAPERSTAPDPEPDFNGVDSHSIAEVLQAVQAGVISAEDALEQELAGRHRSTLIGELERMIED